MCLVEVIKKKIYIFTGEKKFDYSRKYAKKSLTSKRGKKSLRKQNKENAERFVINFKDGASYL